MAVPIFPRIHRGRVLFQVADVLFPSFAQAVAAWSAVEADRLDATEPGQQPARRCDDCALNLGRDVLRALGSCPRWGKPRHGVESRCAKDGAR